MRNRRTVLQSAVALATYPFTSRLARAAVSSISKLPLLQSWSGPLQSPPFDKAKVADFEPAFAPAFSSHMAEIDRIATETAAPSFDNTIAALERSGRLLTRVASIFNNLSGTMSDDAMQAAERALTPKLAAHSDAIALKPGLYPRVALVHKTAGSTGLSPEQQRVAARYEIELVRSGARLSAEAQRRLTVINQRLAGLYTTFSQNLLADEERYSLLLETEADVAGLPQAAKDDAAAAAAEKGHKGKWLIANTRSSMEPFLTFADRRDLREKGWRMWIRRGDNGDAHDNKKAITEILSLRIERAKLLGFPTHAHFQLADTMAGTPRAALDLMQAVWKPAVKAVLADRDTFQQMIDAEGGKFKLQPWDWRYYAEKTRKTRYDVDETEVKPYLQLSKIREATFWCAGKLYGLSFEPRRDVPVYHSDVSVWTVKGPDGATIGLFYFDPYARAGKNSGAWMNAIRDEEHFEAPTLPLVINACNFVKPAPGAPALLSIDDAITTFHEFGHALHGLLSRTAYPLVSGTNVPRDFVEFPSQFNEHWATRPEVLERFAIHYQTGKPMPRDLIERIVRAKKFNAGFGTVEYLASAWFDMDVHLSQDPVTDIDAFEKSSLAKLGLPSEIVMRHRPTQFGHLFSDDGYSAGYYAYLWSQVLDNDGFAAFEESGDVFNPDVARRMQEEVLTRGNSRDPAESYRAFRGREPKIDALLRNRGFT